MGACTSTAKTNHVTQDAHQAAADELYDEALKDYDKDKSINLLGIIINQLRYYSLF